MLLSSVVPATAAEFVVKATTIPEMKAVFGQVESRIVVPARARIEGSVRELHISHGDEVTEGQALAVVVDDKLVLQLNAADAKIEALRAHQSQLGNHFTEVERSVRRGLAMIGARYGVAAAEEFHRVVMG